MVEMGNALYYTFSTIAQTLAGLLGLFAAFLALRINAFNHVIYECMNDLHKKLQREARWSSSELSELFKHRWRGDAPAFFHALRAMCKMVTAHGVTGNPAQQGLDQEEEALLSQGKSLVERKRKLLKAAQYVIGRYGNDSLETGPHQARGRDGRRGPQTPGCP
jgi:hypothetical protein